MHRLFLLIFLLPWYVVAALTALMLWFAQAQVETAREVEAQKALALQAEMPLAVPIDQFAQTDRHTADEVHVTAWINLEHNYRLTHRGKFGKDEWMMYVLFGPDDPDTGKVARGVVLIDPDRIDDFAMMMVGSLRPELGSQLNFDLNGQDLGYGDYSSLVIGALDERGLERDSDFLVISPFMDGRAAGLAPDPLAVLHKAGGALTLVAGLALLTAVKFRRWQKRRAAQDSVPAQATTAAPVPAATRNAAPAIRSLSDVNEAFSRPNAAGTLAPSVQGWSPIQSVMSRHADRLASLASTDPGPRAAINDNPIRVVPRFGGMRQMVPLVIGGLLVLFLYTSTDLPREMRGIGQKGSGDASAQMAQAPLPSDAERRAPPSGQPAPKSDTAQEGQEMLGDPQRSLLSMLLNPSDSDLFGLFVTFAAAVPLMAFQRFRRRKGAQDDPWDRRLR